MSSLAFEDLEIVGFDGTVLVECEAVLPVARHKPTDLFFKLVAGSDSQRLATEFISFSTKDEIEAYVKEGRLTLLPEPVAAFAGAVVVYVDENLLAAADIQLPDYIRWQQLMPHVWVGCSTQEVVEDLLDYWATRLMNEATLLLEEFFLENNQKLCKRAEYLTDMALCAAEGATLRARIYLRAGVSIMFSDTPERLDNLYQLTVRHEFKDWTWETFQVRLRRLIDLLKDRASIRRSRRKEDESSYKAIIDAALDARSIQNIWERYAECESLAQLCREDKPIHPSKVDAVARVLSVSTQLRLDDQILEALAGDPLFYYLGDSIYDPTFRREDRKDNEYPLMNSEIYLKTAEDFLNKGLDPGQVARRAVERSSVKPAYAQ